MTAALFLIFGALMGVAVVLKEIVYEIRKHVRVGQPAARRHAPVFVPLHCGRAVEYRGVTETCGRRASHGGRCMCEVEIQQVADLGGPVFHQVEIRPATSSDDDLRVAVAELDKHMADMPELMIDRQTVVDDAAWISALRTMVQAAVRRAGWHEETREHDVGQYR